MNKMLRIHMERNLLSKKELILAVQTVRIPTPALR